MTTEFLCYISCLCSFRFVIPLIFLPLRWLNPLFSTGYKRSLEEDDMFEVLAEDKSERLGHELQSYWDQSVQKANKNMQAPSLSKAIIQCYWKSYAVLGFFTLVEWILVFQGS
uniref:Uncharacterized protein n=1 Tax=Sphaeramia orbicularis TaxID=375764 RepID=A0A672ZS76_9TELE